MWRSITFECYDELLFMRVLLFEFVNVHKHLLNLNECTSTLLDCWRRQSMNWVLAWYSSIKLELRVLIVSFLSILYCFLSFLNAGKNMAHSHCLLHGNQWRKLYYHYIVICIDFLYSYFIFAKNCKIIIQLRSFKTQRFPI